MDFFPKSRDGIAFMVAIDLITFTDLIYISAL